MAIEDITPIRFGEDTFKYLLNMGRAIQQNMRQLKPLAALPGISGTLTIDLGSGSTGKIAITITNGVVTAYTISAGASAGITWV